MKKWIAVGISVAVLSAADIRTGINSTWKLNTAKSDFGPLPAPNSVVTTIKHEDPKLELTSQVSGAQGEYTANYKYTTDGKECTNVNRGFESKATVKWDGEALVVDAKVKFGDNDVTIKDRYTLSEDGKVLKLSRRLSGPQGEADQTYIYDKQ